MKNFVLTYWWVAVALYWSSTIVAHDWKVEENPFMRDIWRYHGDMGFTVASIIFGIVWSLIFYYSLKYKYYVAVVLAGFPMITFKVLIALTNLAVIPYWITGWFQF